MRTIRNRAFLRTVVIGTLLTFATGCFRYVPADLHQVEPGTGARVVVTRAGSEQLREVIPDARDGAPVQGTFVGTEGNNLLLAVPVAQRQQGMTPLAIEQRIQIPVGEVVGFERRELNGPATAFTLAAGVGAIVGLIFVITESRKGDNPNPPGPPDESIVEIPILSLLFGR